MKGPDALGRFCVCEDCYDVKVMRWEEHTDPTSCHGDCDLCGAESAEHAFCNPIAIIKSLLRTQRE